MSDFAKNILTLGAVVGIGAIVLVAFPELLPAGALITDSMMENLDDFGTFFPF